MSGAPILSVQDVVVEFGTQRGTIRALDGVSLEVLPGETVAVVGESGCGKTTLARAILGLQPMEAGKILFKKESSESVGHRLAEKIGMVWQDPFASLDPRWRIRRVLEEPGRILGRQVDIDALIDSVGLSREMADRFPHQLSGGQRQRVAIGRALALKPPLVICDEPTAALDLSVQAQILNLLRDLQAELSCAFLYISHDLTTVRYLADRVAVMYMGKVVEEGPTDRIFERPLHPYTKALLESAPTLEHLGELPAVAKGEIPDPTKAIKGCKFATRCPRVQDVCREAPPAWFEQDRSRALCNFPHSIASIK
ncbi:MAG TPA: ABC transporter ATP-binding protein [Fimbriimonadaceae bacterium]|nr:ABC transporter ATP-binding protein [Fimbriimonadaceae bacterium]